MHIGIRAVGEEGHKAGAHLRVGSLHKSLLASSLGRRPALCPVHSTQRQGSDVQNGCPHSPIPAPSGWNPEKGTLARILKAYISGMPWSTDCRIWPSLITSVWILLVPGWFYSMQVQTQWRGEILLSRKLRGNAGRVQPWDSQLLRYQPNCSHFYD